MQPVASLGRSTCGPSKNADDPSDTRPSRRILPRLYYVPPIILQWCIRLATRAIWRSRRRVIVLGTEHLDTLQPPVVFVMNHTSDWDGPLLRSILPMVSKWGPMFCVGLTRDHYRKKHQHLFGRLMFGGIIFRLLGAYPVYRGTRDLDFALQHHIQLVREGRCVLIFPEGRKGRDGKLKRFKHGVAHLAAVTGTTCVPVAISGINQEEIDAGVANKGVLTVTFGTPLQYPEGHVQQPNEDALNDFATKLKTKVKKLLESHKRGT